MPLSVTELLDSCALKLDGSLNWGEKSNCENKGIYIVSLSADPSQNVGLLKAAPIYVNAIENWIKRVQTFKLDTMKNPEKQKVADRIGKFWLEDENILYIGKTDRPIKNRLSEYYRTKLGNRSPHAGGHWIKTLNNLNKLYIYYSKCNDPVRTEKELIDFFIQNVSRKTRDNLFDSNLPIPFANLKHPNGLRKKTGISKSTK